MSKKFSIRWNTPIKENNLDVRGKNYISRITGRGGKVMTLIRKGSWVGGGTVGK